MQMCARGCAPGVGLCALGCCVDAAKKRSPGPRRSSGPPATPQLLQPWLRWLRITKCLERAHHAIVEAWGLILCDFAVGGPPEATWHLHSVAKVLK